MLESAAEPWKRNQEVLECHSPGGPGITGSAFPRAFALPNPSNSIPPGTGTEAAVSEWYPESRSLLKKVAPHLRPPGRNPSCLLGSGALLHGFKGTSAGRFGDSRVCPGPAPLSQSARLSGVGKMFIK